MIRVSIVSIYKYIFCINQLLSIAHDTCQSFVNGFEVRGVFLDISKTFDKVWQKGLINNKRKYLKQTVVVRNLLSTLTNFLKGRTQKIILNVQHSACVNLKAGVPQGSIIRPLLFLNLIWRLGGNFTPVGFLLIAQKRKMLKPWYFAVFSNFLLETFLPKLVSLTLPRLQILRKTQNRVFPISRFLVNPL